MQESIVPSIRSQPSAAPVEAAISSTRTSITSRQSSRRDDPNAMSSFERDDDGGDGDGDGDRSSAQLDDEKQPEPISDRADESDESVREANARSESNIITEGPDGDGDGDGDGDATMGPSKEYGGVSSPQNSFDDFDDFAVSDDDPSVGTNDDVMEPDHPQDSNTKASPVAARNESRERHRHPRSLAKHSDVSDVKPTEDHHQTLDDVPVLSGHETPCSFHSVFALNGAADLQNELEIMSRKSFVKVTRAMPSIRSKNKAIAITMSQIKSMLEDINVEIQTKDFQEIVQSKYVHTHTHTHTESSNGFWICL